MPPSHIPKQIVPKPRPATVWLTRDSNESGPLEFVKVWLDRPVRVSWDKGVFWTCSDEKSLWHCYTLADAQHFYRTIPDDQYQLVRNGN